MLIAPIGMTNDFGKLLRPAGVTAEDYERESEPITEETAFVVTDAGMDALRMTDALETTIPGPTEADAPDAATDSPDAETFTPDTKERADWVLGKIADARSRAARIRENAETMAKQAEAEATFFEWKYGAALQAFARQELSGGKRKSLTLYHGTLGFKTCPSRMKIAPGQESAAVAWAKEHNPEALSERVDIAALKECIQITDAGQAVDPDTGECLEWVSVVPSEEQFYIR